jgi:hypothetical protein
MVRGRPHPVPGELSFLQDSLFFAQLPSRLMAKRKFALLFGMFFGTQALH